MAVCVRLQPQNMEDESIGMTQIYTAQSYERSLRSSHAGVVKVSQLSSQIPFPQTTRRDKPQCRGTISNVFEVRMKTFLKSTSHYLQNSPFLLKVYVPHNY